MSQAHSLSLPRLAAVVLVRPRLLPLFGFVAALLVLSIFFVWSRVQVLNLEYSISSLESRIRAAEQETSRLRLEAASLKHPGRIELVARQELGLRLPDPSQVINVR